MYRDNQSKDLVMVSSQPKKPLACRLFGCKLAIKHPKLVYVMPLEFEDYYTPFILCMCERCGEDLVVETDLFYVVYSKPHEGDGNLFTLYNRGKSGYYHVSYEYINYLKFEALKPKRSFRARVLSFFKKRNLNKVYQKESDPEILVYLDRTNFKIIKTKSPKTATSF